MTRRKFSREFKIEAVRLVTDRGVAVAQAARDLDIAESVLRRWMRELTATPVTAFPGNGQMRADLAEIAALKKPNVEHHRQADDLWARLEVAERGALGHQTRLSEHPGRLKKSSSDNTKRMISELILKYRKVERWVMN